MTGNYPSWIEELPKKWYGLPNIHLSVIRLIYCVSVYQSCDPLSIMQITVCYVTHSTSCDVH